EVGVHTLIVATGRHRAKQQVSDRFTAFRPRAGPSGRHPTARALQPTTPRRIHGPCGPGTPPRATRAPRPPSERRRRVRRTTARREPRAAAHTATAAR